MLQKNFGAEGIGLCRTEHMFFDEGRINSVREMILATDEQARRVALSKLLPMQKNDFVELFEVMGDLPVTIRLLDPPFYMNFYLMKRMILKKLHLLSIHQLKI